MGRGRRNRKVLRLDEDASPIISGRCATKMEAVVSVMSWDLCEATWARGEITTSVKAYFNGLLP